MTVHDLNHSPALDGAVVTGVWSVGDSSSCTTVGSTGMCVVSLVGLRKNVGSVSFTVTDVTLTGAVYTPAANHDVDGSSDGTSITVTRR